MRELAKRFFLIGANKIGIGGVIIWLLEYVVLSCTFDMLPQYVVATTILIGYALIMYAVYSWVTKKHSTEYWIYTLIILEFIFNKLNQEQVFVGLFKCPFWVLYIVLLIYFFSRVFILEKVYHFLHDIYLGFLDSRREKINEKIAEIAERQEVLANEKAERAEYIKKRSLSRRQFWSNLRDVIFDLVLGIIDFFVAIPQGILAKRTNRKKKAEKTSKTEINPSQSDEMQEDYQAKSRNKIPMWVKVVFGAIILFFVALFCLLLYYQIFLSPVDNQSSSVDILKNLSVNLSNTNNLVEFASKIIVLIVIDAVVFVFFIILAFIVFVVIIQIIKSGYRMVEDLLKSIENKNTTGTDYSSIVFYSVIVFVICVFVSKLYPFNIDDLAELIYNGSFIIFPVMMAVFIPIITMIIDLLKSGTISSFLNNVKAKEIKEQFAGLALGTLQAILNYLTFVTKDFLLSIQELSTDEFIKKSDEADKQEADEQPNDEGKKLDEVDEQPDDN